MATGNPAMNEAVYRRTAMETTASAMTIQGTVLKTTLLMLILLATATYTWTLVWSPSPEADQTLLVGLLFGGLIGGFIIALVTIFIPKISPITAPIYAALEGLVLGAISAFFEKMYPGIVLQAVGASVGVLAIMLFVYGTGIIRATEKFKIGVVAATGAICLVYLVDWIMSIWGDHVPFINQSGVVGIGFSVIVVIIAALNLILDFDFIEQGIRLRAPKYMEWYGGFSLLVTLVWMYLEILRLLAKLRGNSRD